MGRRLSKQPRRGRRIGIHDEEKSLPLRRRVVLITEGQATEPDYFTHCIKDYIQRDISLQIASKHSGDYRQLVRVAQNEEKRSSAGESDYWIVADIEHRHEQADFQVLVNWVASSTKHHLALSNTMFEVWVLMHKSVKNISGGESSTLLELMRRHVIEQYSKNNKRLYNVVFNKSEIECAIKIARQRRQSMNESSFSGVFIPMNLGVTTVDELVTDICSNTNS